MQRLHQIYVIFIPNISLVVLWWKNLLHNICIVSPYLLLLYHHSVFRAPSFGISCTNCIGNHKNCNHKKKTFHFRRFIFLNKQNQHDSCCCCCERFLPIAHHTQNAVKCIIIWRRTKYKHTDNILNTFLFFLPKKEILEIRELYLDI